MKRRRKPRVNVSRDLASEAICYYSLNLFKPKLGNCQVPERKPKTKGIKV